MGVLKPLASLSILYGTFFLTGAFFHTIGQSQLLPKRAVHGLALLLIAANQLSEKSGIAGEVHLLAEERRAARRKAKAAQKSQEEETKAKAVQKSQEEEEKAAAAQDAAPSSPTEDGCGLRQRTR